MDVEQQMRETYAERLGALELSGGDVDAARRNGARMRARRRVAVGAAARGDRDHRRRRDSRRDREGVGRPLARRRSLARAPGRLRSRRGRMPRRSWTGREVIVLGGERHPCPPNADCAVGDEALRDGAAYDIRTNSWRPIPPAPVPVGPGNHLMVADGVVVLSDTGSGTARWFTYEPDHNRWSRVDDVPPGVGDSPSAYRVQGLRDGRTPGRRVRRDSGSDGRCCPPIAIQPALTQRTLTATDAGPVVTGEDSTPTARRQHCRHCCWPTSGTAAGGAACPPANSSPATPGAGPGPGWSTPSRSRSTAAR